jgi:hypothetical protein
VTGRYGSRVRIVGSVLVRNEDLFVERAIRNVADFCDEMYAFDHMSDDCTSDVLRGLAREFDHLHVTRAARTAASHRSLEPYAGTRTWALGVDGDELFDPDGLARLRQALLAGEHGDVFRLKGHVLNCDDLDEDAGVAGGYMAPPSRPITKLFNLAAVDDWTGSSQRLHDGWPTFRSGYHWESLRYLSERLSWEDDPLRCLHVCFLRRSSTDAADDFDRPNVNETGAYNRSPVGVLKRKLKSRVAPPDVLELHRQGTTWKRAWYTRGDRVTVDAAPFLRRG